MTPGAAGRRAVLGLGSNLGDRAFHLRAAVAALVDEVTATSAVWETAPVGGPEQGPYLNLAVALRTERTPHELLDVCRRLETAAERVRHERWGPRTLDVDVLWVDGTALDEPELTVPHPRMFERDFVLAPLAEVAGDLVPSEWAGPGADVVRLGPLDGDLPVPPEGPPGPAGLVDRRRSVLEVALDIHPDLYLDQLATALAAAGLGEVDEEDLVADVSALGYDVDPDEEPGPADVEPSTPDADESPDDGAPRRGPVPVTDAFADDLRSPAPDAADREPRTVVGIDRTVLVAAAVALLVVVVAFALAAIGGRDGADETTVGAGSGEAGADADDGDPQAPTEGTTDGTTPGGGDDPGTTPPAAPVGPGADPELADGGDASTSFDGADGDQLPDLGDLSWDVVHGAVTVVDGRVVATPDEGDPDGVVVAVDPGAAEVRFEVGLPEATDGSGVAFGLADDGSYLLWALAPRFPTVALYRVSDGGIEFISNGGVTYAERGVRLGISRSADGVELLAGGAVLGTYTGPVEGTAVGIGVLPEQAFGVFDDAVVDATA